MRDRLLPAPRVTEADAPILVRPAATRAEQVAALTLLLADTSAPDDLPADVEQVVALHAQGELSLDGLLIAADGPSVVLGTTLVTPGAGGAADLFPPRFARSLSAPAASSAATALLSAAGEFAVAAGCDRLQAFADPVRTDDAAQFAAARFDRIAELRLLRRDCSRPLGSYAAPWDSLRTLAPESERLFRETTRESYAGSRDAPDARGADADADFAAHQAAAGFRPDLCRLALRDGEALGLVLISASGEGAAAEWDVCYLGVSPAQRGRGVGRALLRDRLAAARDAGAAAVTCVVDAANEPAHRLYVAAGFVETGSRVLFLKRLEPEASAGWKEPRSGG
ncbi:GNAT family N-acetyltransferase [Alienimonas californiensis]|uniref:Putative acetyltransferase n=1 Tax=Alienimonas californiensis TaxID=2527989 RepID=A0A517PC50_9PLAN|nr:GNAT family N-acetyltransferase [Alienimonas californiensis]QDT16939.1 putative acetyltransferase [Alienimonas californiensis]